MVYMRYQSQGATTRAAIERKKKRSQDVGRGVITAKAGAAFAMMG